MVYYYGELTSVLQKKTIRIINGTNFYSHIESLFKEHQTLNIYDLYSLCVLGFIFKYTTQNIQLILKNILNLLIYLLFCHLRNNHIRNPIHDHSFIKCSLLFECIRIIQSSAYNIDINVFTFI